MALHPTFAFKVIIEAGDQRREHIVAGCDLAEAAVTAQERMPSGGRVIRMVELGKLLAAPAVEVFQVASTTAAAHGKTTTAAPEIREDASTAGQRQGGSSRRRKATAALQGAGDPAPASQSVPQQGTRRDQLLALLRDHDGGPVHREVIAQALGVSLVHGDKLARNAIRDGLAERVGSRSGLVRLVEGAGVTKVLELEPVVANTSTTSASTPTESRTTGPTRVEQLIALLNERRGQVHITEIADALGTTRGNADNVVRAGIRTGLVARAGSRTGLVRLAKAAAEPAPAAEPVPEVSPALAPKKVKPPTGPTRVDRLVVLLEARQGAVHVTDIAEALSMTRGNVDSTVLAGVRAGLVRRVGQRAGLVELAAPPSALDGVPGTPGDRGVTTTPAVLELLEAAQIDGLQQRVYDALVELDGPATAKEVALQVGCRPREAGNALALLVEGGLVEREQGDKSPGTPNRYTAISR